MRKWWCSCQKDKEKLCCFDDRNQWCHIPGGALSALSLRIKKDWKAQVAIRKPCFTFPMYVPHHTCVLYVVLLLYLWTNLIAQRSRSLINALVWSFVNSGVRPMTCNMHTKMFVEKPCWDQPFRDFPSTFKAGLRGGWSGNGFSMCRYTFSILFWCC